MLTTDGCASFLVGCTLCLSVLISYSPRLVSSDDSPHLCTGNEPAHPQGYCGSSLSDIVSLVCGGDHNIFGKKRSGSINNDMTSHFTKRSSARQGSDYTGKCCRVLRKDKQLATTVTCENEIKNDRNMKLCDIKYIQGIEFGLSKFAGRLLEKKSALSYLKADKREYGYQQNINCECCVNRCSQCELAEYCNIAPFTCVDGVRQF